MVFGCKEVEEKKEVTRIEKTSSFDDEYDYVDEPTELVDKICYDIDNYPDDWKTSDNFPEYFINKRNNFSIIFHESGTPLLNMGNGEIGQYQVPVINQEDIDKIKYSFRKWLFRGEEEDLKFIKQIWNDN